MKTRLIIGGLFSFAIAAALTVPAPPAKASSRASLPQADQKKMMHDKLQEVVNDLNLSDDQKRAKMKELHTGTMAKVNEVLTPEQRTQLKEKLEAAKPKAPASNY